MKLVIATPAFNVVKYIKDLYEKISENISEKYEVIWIIINDGSTDGIESLVNSWNKKWINLVNKKNGGLGTARTAAIIEARKINAEYIWHMDADDYMVAGSFEKIFPYLNGKNEIIKLGDLLLDHKTQKIKKDKIYSLKNFKKNFQVWPQGLIIKVKSIPSNFYYMPKNGDISNLILFDVVSLENIIVIMEYISVYRVNIGSSMSTTRNYKVHFRSYEYAMEVSRFIKNKKIKKIAIKGARNDLCFSIFLSKKDDVKINIYKIINNFNYFDRFIIILTKITPKIIPKLFIK